MSDDQPDINQFEIDLSAEGTLGLIYKFKVRATTYNGDYVDTNSLFVALASLPSQPSVAPWSIAEITDTKTLGIRFALLDSSLNGGSEITLYEVQYDDGDRGEFQSVFQLQDTIIIAEGIKASAEYRFRYRAQNFNGWGPFSDLSYYFAATKPEKPPAPVYISSSADEIRLAFLRPDFDGGSLIQGYKLFVDTIQQEPAWREIYTGDQTEVTLNVVDHELETGKNYRYVLVVYNVFGDSPQSEELRVAQGSLPMAPGLLTRVDHLSD